MANTHVTYQDNQMPAGQRLYTKEEIISYCDTNWRTSSSLQTMKKLDAALGHVLNKKPVILVSGSNGKSSTIHFLTQLLLQEHISFGALTSPHFTLYQERINYNGMAINSHNFTTYAQQVLQTATQEQLTLTSKELLLATACLYFTDKDVDIIILENNDSFGIDPTLACSPLIHAITRLVEPTAQHDIFQAIESLMSSVTTKTHVISADQNKLHLQIIKQTTMKHFGSWVMPIRKITALSYPYEQMYGRCAALAEKIGTLCLQLLPHLTKSSSTLLGKQSTRRGRPSLQDIKKAQQQKTLNLPQFWQQVSPTAQGHFQIIAYNNMRYLVDIAANTDAIENSLLGIRLLHYKQQAKNLQIIIGFYEEQIDQTVLFKILTSFFKKISGTIFVCPVQNSPGETMHYTSCNVMNITNALKSSGLKTIACTSLQDALDKAVHPLFHKDNVTVVMGTQDLIKEFYTLQKS